MARIKLVNQASKRVSPETKRTARQWFRDVVRSATARIRPIGATRSYGTKVATVAEDMIGQMCFFAYDPKHKKTLPYYDRFPLILVVDIKPDGWTGLNLHYLPPILRAKLLDALLDVRDGQSDSKGLALSYKMLAGASKLSLFRPCFKRYLKAHVRTRIDLIDMEEWSKVVMLPSQRFEKKSATYVWKQSEMMA